VKTEIITIDPREIKLLELNARYMRHEQYQLLVENIKRDGKLTSVPFCWKTPKGEWECLSGNHRVMAAIDAGLETIDVMVTEEKLTEQQRIAIQLSHNAIAGEDDPAVLKELYLKIDEIVWKEYTGLDDKTLKLLEDVELHSISPVSLEYQIISFAFLPDEAEKAKQVFDELITLIQGNEIWAARYKDYDKFLDTLSQVSDSYDVKNTATAISLMLKIVERHITDLSEGWINEDDKDKRRGRVPIASAIGTDLIPVRTAKRLKKLGETMVGNKEIEKEDITKMLDVLMDTYAFTWKGKSEGQL